MSIGQRLNLNGEFGTIRFVSEIDDMKGIWLGVEWDSPERGKHSGVKDGKQYFTCR
jgi:dynactin complex subunit